MKKNTLHRLQEIKSLMPHYLAVFTDGKFNQQMLLEIIAWLLVARDGNVRSNKCLGYIY
jgi:hypothetical protein